MVYGMFLTIAFARWPIFKIVSFQEYFLFLQAAFVTEQLLCSRRVGFDMFFAFLIFDLNWEFCKGYSLCMGFRLLHRLFFEKCPIFKIAEFSNIWWFFKCFSGQKNTSVLVELILACFWHFQFRTPTEHFAKSITFAWAIAFERWPILKIVLYLQYLIISQAAFCKKTTLMPL